MANGYFTAGANNIVAAGKSALRTQHKILTVANMYPGRLVTPGASISDVKVASPILKPLGWLGYEETASEFQPDGYDTIYKVNEFPMVERGGGFAIRAKAALGFNVLDGDLLCNWDDGMVAPCIRANGGVMLRIPFTKKTSEFDTGVNIPAGMTVQDVMIQVVTNVSSGTIDVGILSSEAGGDADGFVDGESAATAGIVSHVNGDTTEANNTLGALLVAASVKSADTSAKYFDLPKKWVGDGTATSITYTTSNHAVDGFIWVHCVHPNITVVGKAHKAVDATGAAAAILVENYL